MDLSVIPPNKDFIEQGISDFRLENVTLCH